ncbi:MAG TPA: hypothetical protein VKZ53_26680 [Candidatus Angelobacter sp.]|nr:hypothetical protein [Candidatus Angelobacter sp.]
MGRTVFVLHSALAPNAVADALLSSMDEEQWTLFSMSGYRGNRPVLGEVSQKTFRLRKRINHRNDFARQFYGRFEPEPGGTRIEGHFDTPGLSKYFMRIWLAFAVLIGVPIFIQTAIAIVGGSHSASDNEWIGLVVPPVLVLFGIALPKIGRLLGKGDEHFIVEHLQNTLAARIEVQER